MRDRITVVLLRVLLACGAVGGIAWPALAAPQLTVFGDSYSVPIHGGAPTWVTQLKNEHVVGTVHDFAKSGAVTADQGTNTFARQIRLWNAAHHPLGDTVVYLGYNDINGKQSFNPSRTGFQNAINALVAAGATRGGNHLYIILPHDVGSTPEHNINASQRSFYRQRTIQWNNFLRSVANQKNVVVFDVFATIDQVIKNPGSFGFTNVKTPDHKHSGSTALYDSLFHFGQHGQAIIAGKVRERLARAALIANGGAPQPQVTAQLDAGVPSPWPAFVHAAGSLPTAAPVQVNGLDR
jgi:phospholipase/lecithinase/hemolysin